MRPVGERGDLERHIGQLRGLEQLVDLRAHHLRAADRAAQGRLVHHRPETGGVRTGEQFLALHAQGDMALDVVRARLPDGAGLQHPARVVLGLEQAGDEVRLVGADEGGRALQADVHGEPARQDVVEPLPPAGPVGLLGQLDEELGLVVGDAVGLQQQLEVRDFEGDLGHLHAADGGGGDTEDAGGLLALQPGAFPQVQQAPAEDHLAHRRRGPRLAHAPTSTESLHRKFHDSPAAPFEDSFEDRVGSPMTPIGAARRAVASSVPRRLTESHSTLQFSE